MESFEDDDLLHVSPAKDSHRRKLRRLKKALSMRPATAGDNTLNPQMSLDPDPLDHERREFDHDDDGLDPLFSAPAQPQDDESRHTTEVRQGRGEHIMIHENVKSAKKRLNLDSEEGEDDELLLISSAEDSHNRKLRHIKKALPRHPATAAEDSLNHQRSLDPDTLDSERKEFEDEDGLDPLFFAPSQPLDSGFLDPMEVQNPSNEGITINENAKSAKKRLYPDSEGGEHISATSKKKKSGKSADDRRESKESIRQKIRIEKEMNAHRQLIHVESQRLLRETKNASFKPVPLFQKPISSVLEMIRQRKLQISKSFGGFAQSILSNHAKILSMDATQNPQLSEPQSAKHQDGASQVVDSEKNESHVILHGKTASCDELNSGESNKIIDNSLSDTLVSSLPTSSSNDDPTDDSSSEEDNDKENVNPYSHVSSKMKPYKEDAFVKDFLDVEAEEEDDSDQDAMRFGEDEDDDENDENDVLNDLIATGYEEDVIDNEKRNQLHQKWLEQQDDVETENVLQRLQCGVLHREDDDEDVNDDSNDLPLPDHVPSESFQKIMKQSKHIILHMFNDVNDGYKTSDDEEAEQAILRQRILRENVEEPSYISSIEDDTSQEVFGLIKKLNIAPDTKKRAKQPSASFETLFNCGNSNSSSKSSFVGRAMSSSFQQKSPILRTFVFGRDDSNSRGSFSLDESSSDVDQKENQQIPTEYTQINKKSKASMSQRNIEQKIGSGSSPFDIIRQSTLNKSHTTLEFSESQTEGAFQFSAFKAGKRASKMEVRS